MCACARLCVCLCACVCSFLILPFRWEGSFFLQKYIVQMMILPNLEQEDPRGQRRIREASDPGPLDLRVRPRHDLGVLYPLALRRQALHHLDVSIRFDSTELNCGRHVVQWEAMYAHTGCTYNMYQVCVYVCMVQNNNNNNNMFTLGGL